MPTDLSPLPPSSPEEIRAMTRRAGLDLPEELMQQFIAMWPAFEAMVRRIPRNLNRAAEPRTATVRSGSCAAEAGSAIWRSRTEFTLIKTPSVGGTAPSRFQSKPLPPQARTTYPPTSIAPMLTTAVFRTRALSCPNAVAVIRAVSISAWGWFGGTGADAI